MGRLIEIQTTHGVPSNLTLQVGDVLQFGATGGRVRLGAEVIELVGAFSSALAVDDGTILTPAGAPNAVQFRARQPGHATIEVMIGDPFHAPKASTVGVTVEP